MSLKSLHITNAWHPKSGGIRTFYLALLDAANRERHEMHLVVPGAEDAVDSYGAHGTIHHVKAPLAPGSGCYRMIYPHEYLMPTGRVNRILREHRPDLVEFCDKYTLNYLGGVLRLGLLPGVDLRPIVVGLSCERFTDSVTTYLGQGALCDWFSRQYLRWVYFPLADHHIAVSRYVADELEAISDGHKVDRGVWLGPMGVDYDAFAADCQADGLRAELLTRTKASDDATLLLFAGRLAREKNIPLLLETMAALERADRGREYRLIVAGDGNLRAQLETAALKMAPGRVCFLGHQSKVDLIHLLRACDVFVHPNPREPFGIGPLEAMAAGLPLVAPNSGGVRNYANRENAWLAEPTPAGFAAAILEAATDRAARESKIANGRLTAKANQWTQAAGHFLNLYRQLNGSAQAEPGQVDLKPMFSSIATRRIKIESIA